MDEAAFRGIVADEWEQVPETYRKRIDNVAILVEDEPSDEVRREEGLAKGETLLGLYHGIPNTERGEWYGSTPALPDTITIYRLPVIDEAHELASEKGGSAEDYIRHVIHETLWHEIGHYFGYDEGSISDREDAGTNDFGTL